MLEKIKREIIDYVLDDLVDGEINDQKRKMKRASLEKMIMDNDTVSSFDDESVEVKSEQINENSKLLYIDLLTAFGLSDALGSEISSYKTANQKAIDNFIAKGDDLLRRITASENSLSRKIIPEFIVEDFTSSNKIDRVSRELHTDRYGQIIPIKNYAYHSTGEDVLTLPYLRRYEALNKEQKVKASKVSIRYQAGAGFIDLTNGVETDLNSILDMTSSFWSQTILTDSKFQMNYKRRKTIDVVESDNYFYDIQDGAVCELKIELESIAKINEIVLDPSTKYPLDIVAIRYTSTNEPGEILKEIISPENEDDRCRSTFLKKKHTYRFKDIECKNIFILFTQRHYEHDIHLYDATSVWKNGLWLKSRNEHVNINKEVTFRARYNHRKHQEINIGHMDLNVVKSSSELAEMFINKPSQIRRVKKYEYQYGFKSVLARNSYFDNTGFVVTRPIGLRSSYRTISIETKEVHPKINGETFTDIEYYITGSRNPSPLDWHSILPTNKKEVTSERLFIREGAIAKLRFKAFNIIDVKDNLGSVSKDDYIEMKDSNGYVFAIRIFNYKAQDNYTISYVPTDASYELDLGGSVNTSIESFLSIGSGHVTLNERPVLFESDSCKVTVSNNTNDYGTAVMEALNVTDPSNPPASYNRFDKSSNQIQFYVLGNNIYFNKEITKGSLVSVTYKHKSSFIITKAILRKDKEYEEWLTPTLQEIKYKIEST